VWVITQAGVNFIRVIYEHFPRFRSLRPLKKAIPLLEEGYTQAIDFVGVNVFRKLKIVAL
jgi:hypothetical protein